MIQIENQKFKMMLKIFYLIFKFLVFILYHKISKMILFGFVSFYISQTDLSKQNNINFTSTIQFKFVDPKT